MKFYICKKNENIIGLVHGDGKQISCCGEEMQELVPQTADRSTEKHVPVIEVNGTTVKVTVGSTPHPMTEQHLIQWIALETKEGNQRKELCPGQEPYVTFSITEGDQVLRAYEYCNIHGLWVAEYNE